MMTPWAKNCCTHLRKGLWIKPILKFVYLISFLGLKPFRTDLSYEIYFDKHANFATILLSVSK